MRSWKSRTRVLLLLALLGFTGILLIGCTKLLLNVAGFNAYPSSGKQPLEVQFAPAVGGNVSGWWWSFGDGGGSVEQSPDHTYEQPGVYTVVLAVTPRLGGPITVVKEDFITVRPGGFAAPKDRLVVGDDDINLYYVEHSTDHDEFFLDVLANDYSTGASAKLHFNGLRKEGDEQLSRRLEYGERNCESEMEIVCSDEERRIVLHLWNSYMSDYKDEYILPVFYYEVTDGVRTAEGRVVLDWEAPPPPHTHIKGKT